MEAVKIFIKTNNKELREKLSEYGIRKNILDDFSCPWLAVNYGMYISVNEFFDNQWNKDHICCESDETELFLAICAIRENTDIDQYFITDADLADLDGVIQCPKGSLIKCTVPNYTMEKDIFNNSIIPAHKASISELLAHREALKSL